MSWAVGKHIRDDVTLEDVGEGRSREREQHGQKHVSLKQQAALVMPHVASSGGMDT